MLNPLPPLAWVLSMGSPVEVPVGFDDPMYMIVNLAMGSKYFSGVGVVDGESPVMVEFEIDRISAYQIDPYQSDNVLQSSMPDQTNITGDINAR